MMIEKRSIIKRLFILIFLFSGSLILFIFISSGVEREKIDGLRLKEIPLSFSEWEGKDLPLEEKVYSILETRDIVFREYRRKDQTPIWLLIVYCANNRAGFHPPEICFKGGSFQLEDCGKEAVVLKDKNTLWTNRLLMKDGEQKLLVYYWFTAGKDNFVNYYRQQVRLIVDQIKQRKNYGSLMRVSTFLEDDNYEIAKRRLEVFCQDLMELFKDFP